MVWDNPKIFLIIVILIILSNGLTMLMSKIISDIAVENADRILNQSAKNFGEIKALQVQLSNEHNKLNTNASDPITNVYVLNGTNATR